MDSRALKNAAMIGVAVVLLAAAAYYLGSGDVSRLVADDPSARLSLQCRACGAAFSLSAAEQDRAFRGGGASAMRSGEATSYRCKKCGKMTGARLDQAADSQPAAP